MEGCSKKGVIQILIYAAQAQPQKTAIVYKDLHISYQDMLSQIDHWTNALIRYGVQRGTHVAIISRNCPEYLELEFALYQMGAVAVKINWRMTAPEIAYILRQNHVATAFVGPGVMATLQLLREVAPAVDFIPFVSIDDASPFAETLSSTPWGFSGAEIDDQEVAFIVHTSGTTGKPKFLSFTHGDLRKKIAIGLEALPFTDKTKFIMVEQFFHIACMRAYMTLSAGGTLVLLPSSFEPDQYLATIQREQVTDSGMVPAVLKQVLENPGLDQYDLGSLKTINYSTCAMPYPLVRKAMYGLKWDLYQVYGMTEMLGLVTVLTPEDHRQGKMASVGRPVKGYEVKICGEDDACCQAGSPGEICIRGPVMMREYIGQEAMSRSVLKGGWYHSGDIGYLDGEGYLYVQGRKDDLIISGGENIYPQEIIDVLMELQEDIAEVAIYGLPDPLWGEKVWASVVLQEGSTLTEKDLRDYCKKHLANYKVPKGFEFVKSLPRNTAGKVLTKLAAKEADQRLQRRAPLEK